jgi:hypothetical protein
MLRRAAFAASFAGALLSFASAAHADGAWLSTSSLTPTEQRVAVSVGPTRTTIWTSLRFQAAGGTMAIVVPAPPGASLDFASDAWFEALEVATAPRIFPPQGKNPFCPGKSGSPGIFQIEGTLSHSQSLVPQDVAVLDDANAVASWAAQANLVVSPKLAAALAAIPNTRFVGVRFSAPPGAGVTPTLRVAMPGAPPVLPLALTHAAGDDLRVVTWIIGQGEADLIGGTKVSITPSTLAWEAGHQASNYEDLRTTALLSGADTFLVEAAGHDALAQNQSIAQGAATIDAVITTFFERAAAYGDGNFDAPTCIASATTALASSAAVSASCPHAALGVVEPAIACTESPQAGEVAPAALRCGSGADDLAVALSGLTPAKTWVTRQTMIIPNGADGANWYLGFGTAAPTSSVLYSATVDTSDCGDGGTSTNVSTSTGTGSAGHGSSGSGGVTSGGSVGAGGPIDEGGDVYLDLSDAAGSCDCSGTSSTGSNSDTCDSGGESASDSCSSSSSSDSCSSSSGDSCGGSGGESCSGGGDSCSGGGEACSGGGSSCSGGDFGKCSTAGSRKARGPRLSVILVAAAAVLAPLRRRGRRRARAKG